MSTSKRGAPGRPNDPPASIAIAVIGGSGLYRLFDDVLSDTRSLATPYGKVTITIGTLGGRDVAFLPRHGSDHSVAPHLINYRANIWALASLGVRAIISTAAVGAVHPDYPVGSLVIVDQYIDRTHSRVDTFFDQGSVQHLASADPFSATLGAIAVEHSVDPAGAGLPTVVGGTVAVIQGPRFSTRAESLWMRDAGAHLVNMTLYPEVPLAAELGIGTVTLAYVTDNDAAPSEIVSAELVFARLAQAQPAIIRTIDRIAAAIPQHYRATALISQDAIDAVLARPVS